MGRISGILRDGAKAAQVLPVMLFGFLVPFAAVSFNIAFPVITRELGLTTVHTAWVPTVYLIAGAVIGLPIGRIARRIGNRNAFATGIFTYTAGAVAVALSGGFQILALSFFTMGSGSAMIAVTGRSLIYGACDVREREGVYGLLISVISIGTLAGNFLGGAVIHFLSWRWIFVANAFFGVASLPLILRKAPSGDGDPSQKGFDLPGTLLYTLFIVSFLLGFSHFPSETSFFLIPFSVLMLITFGWYETRTPSPLLRISLFRESTEFRFSSLTTAVRQYSTYGIWFLMSFYLQHITGLTPAETGLILGTSALVTAVVSAFAGRLAGAIGDRAMIALGLLMNTSGLVILAFIGAEFNLLQILVAMFLLGISSAMAGAPSTSLMFGSVPDEHRSMASATLNLANKMGRSLSMGTVMLLFSLLLGSVHLSNVSGGDFLSCMRTILLIFAVLSAISWIYAAIHRRRTAAAEKARVSPADPVRTGR